MNLSACYKANDSMDILNELLINMGSYRVGLCVYIGPIRASMGVINPSESDLIGFMSLSVFLYIRSLT